jgi:succinyl-CoA synthetase beta subunit
LADQLLARREQAIAVLCAARAEGRRALSEPQAKQLAASFGIAVPRSATVRNEADVQAAIADLSPPFALKVIASALLHKSDAGGVRLRLNSAGEVCAAMREMLALPLIAGQDVEGFLLDEMAAPGHELVIGGVVHPHFGPVLMLGLGGIFVELFSDVSFRICPIERVDAEEMLDELKGVALLRGARGGVVANREKIVETLLAVGSVDGLLPALSGEIAELDFNPVIVNAAIAVAVDARIVLSP